MSTVFFQSAVRNERQLRPGLTTTQSSFSGFDAGVRSSDFWFGYQKLTGTGSNRVRTATCTALAAPEQKPEDLTPARTIACRPVRGFVALCACLYLLSVCVGCVHRRVTVRSDPPGAQVWIGERQIGYTPASFDITWYGTEEITLLKDGYEVETQYVKIPTPWYQVPPLDLISDNLLPFRVKDQHDFMFHLRPRVVVPSHELLERGNALRSEAQLGQ